VELPFDEHERVRPGMWEAWMRVFTAVGDAVDHADEHDSAWLDLAFAVAADRGGYGRDAMLRALATIAHDYRLPASEARRIRAATPPHERAGPTPPETDDEVAAVLAMAHVVADYEARLAD
jgi:hypothetical protein